MQTARTLTFIILVIALFIGITATQAAISNSMNYQGHLTDNAGTPIDGPISMTFAIYDVATGGTALWSDTRSVSVDQGVFSVELGGSSNPFPTGLFENPLWLGLVVGTDAEMTPRRPISSTAYSFKADDANTLEGISASSLDQSAHVIDTANPHGITTTQIGAADAATLAAHIGNTSNPHNVTAAQTGAASSTDFTTHSGDSTAHHVRYTDVEAIAAMGASGDSNPLHHDKYTDSNAVTAVLASDGSGSTLDADLVDGLHASDIIDAAGGDARTPISSLPFTITASGSYYLTDNLDGSTGGININVDNVTIDLMGFTIDGGGSVFDIGIDFLNRSNISLHNGTVTGFGLAGISQAGIANYATIIDIKALGNGTLGTTNPYSGINIASNNSHIERCIAADNGGSGIYISGLSGKVISNTTYNNGGYGISAGIGTYIGGNTAYQNAGLYGIAGAISSVFNNNIAYDNSGSGIYGGPSSQLIGNTSYSNGGDYGIFLDVGASLRDSTSRNNTGLYGIYASNGASLIGNTAYNNSNWGIYTNSGNLVKDNTIYDNNTTNTPGQGGLRISNDSRVIGNTLDNNRQNNIYVFSVDNTIENNTVTDSLNGIFFNTSGNFYGNNRAAGNTTGFNLNATSQTTSPELPNISY